MQADDAPPPPPPDKKCMYYCRVLLGLLASCILLLGVSMQVRSRSICCGLSKSRRVPQARSGTGCVTLGLHARAKL